MNPQTRLKIARNQNVGNTRTSSSIRATKTAKSTPRIIVEEEAQCLPIYLLVFLFHKSQANPQELPIKSGEKQTPHTNTNAQKTCATRMNSSQRPSESKTKINFQMKTEFTTCTFLGSSEICLSRQLVVPLQLPLYPGLARPRAPILNHEDLPSSARELPSCQRVYTRGRSLRDFLTTVNKYKQLLFSTAVTHILPLWLTVRTIPVGSGISRTYTRIKLKPHLFGSVLNGDRDS